MANGHMSVASSLFSPFAVSVALDCCLGYAALGRGLLYKNVKAIFREAAYRQIYLSRRRRAGIS